MLLIQSLNKVYIVERCTATWLTCYVVLLALCVALVHFHNTFLANSLRNPITLNDITYFNAIHVLIVILEV